MKKRKRKRLDGVQIVALAVCISLSFICLYPMYFVFINSISGVQESLAGVYVWPKTIYLGAYKEIVASAELWKSLLMSIFYVVTGTVGMVIVILLSAYALSRRKLVGRRLIVVYILIPMYFGGGMIPSYLNMVQLGLYNTVWALVIPSFVSLGNMILVRTFMTSLPHELEEAAFIDGAGHWKVLWQVVAPLSKPVLAVVSIYSIVGIWNNWMSATIYLTDYTLHPVQMYLKRILVTQTNLSSVLESVLSEEQMEAAIVQAMGARQLQFAVIMVVTLPIIMVYPMFQKYFVKGVMVGSLKG